MKPITAALARVKRLRGYARGRGQTRRDVFSAVYARQMWGRSNEEFFSGEGSSAANTRGYAEMVADICDRVGATVVLDVGCGDFRVGRVLVDTLPSSVAYIGADLVPDLVDHLNARHASDRISFVCCDAIDDELPPADVVLVREVLQHLSNADVAEVLATNLARYPLVVATNAVPIQPTAVNTDIPSGSVSRAAIGSRLALDAEPFGVAVEVLARQPHTNGKAIIETVVWGPMADRVRGDDD